MNSRSLCRFSCLLLVAASCGSEPGTLDIDAAIADASTVDAASIPDAAPPDSVPERVLRIVFTPTADLQFVVWLEDEAGTYVDTIAITDAVGRYGLGNRPGIMEFNSGPAWPHGRRTTTFPVWAHRHGEEFPLVLFQNGDEDNLSHPLGESSPESYYCRPLREEEKMWDTMSCATTVNTDKGRASEVETSLYPPRSDLSATANDDPSVADFAALNPFDVVSRATPDGGSLYAVEWSIPATLPDGNYAVLLEVSLEFDFNGFHDYPSPVGIPWSDYGIAYRGQPSVVYRVPFTLGDEPFSEQRSDYVGYGDPDGLDGDLRPPDFTITTGVAGSGAGRLLLTADGNDTYRARVSMRYR